MGGKDKKLEENSQESPEDCSEDSCDEVDVEEQVEQKIKQLPSLRQKVQAIAINGYLIQKRQLDQKLSCEIEAIERQFRQKCSPFTNQINNIVSGIHKYTDIDFEEIGELLTPQENQNRHNYFTQQKISDYWLKVLTNSDIIGEQIQQRDEPLLKNLIKIQAGKSQDLKKLSIDFYFIQNQWFSNTKLHKQFQVDGEEIKKSYGDQINWKQGKNITIKIVKKKNKKKGGEKKIKEVKQKSFFNFFINIEIDSQQEDNQNQQDDNQIQQLELQYEMAQNIYQDLLPRSLEYYLGVIETVGDYGDLEDIDEQDEQQQQLVKKKGNKLKN